jgi:micrococcal nuclease
MKKASLYTVVVFVLVSGCSLFNMITPQTTVDINTPTITAADEQVAASPFSQLDGIECIPDLSAVEIAQVKRVIDGDSIEVTLDGETYQVRYIGVNTPEYYSEQRPAAIAATQANEKLVAGKTIYLFKDQSNTDKYDRLLRYVLTDEVFVNRELVREGYAEAREYRPDTACHKVFEAVE